MATLLRKEQTELLEIEYPIGCLYISTVSTDPADLFGFGTWSLFGSGRIMVGIDSGDTDFDTAEETRGTKTHTLVEAEIPAHLHTVNPPSTTSGNNSATHTHTYTRYSTVTHNKSGSAQPACWTGNPGSSVNSGNASQDHTHTVDIAEFDSGNAGSGGAHNNLQPYVVVCVWKRTA